MAVTDWRVTTLWPKHGTALSRDKSWVLAMLAARPRLRVAPGPPQAADLTRPPRAARTMPGRDEGTGASIEPRNNHEQAFWPCCHHHSSRTVRHPMVGETEQASHTEIRTLPCVILPKEVVGAAVDAFEHLITMGGNELIPYRTSVTASFADQHPGREPGNGL